MNKPKLVESTYQRDGKWYTLRAIDATNQIEIPATDDEIAAEKAKAPKAETPVKVAKAKPAKAKAKK